MVEQTDIVLWCNSAVHHEPRNEDGKPNSGPRLWPFDDAWEGSAIVMWSGFDLRPRNLFDRTPFYPYTPAPVRPLASQPGAGRGRRTGGSQARRPSEPPGNNRAAGTAEVKALAPPVKPKAGANHMSTLYRLTVRQFDRMIHDSIIREADRMELVEGLLVTKMGRSQRMCRQASEDSAYFQGLFRRLARSQGRSDCRFGLEQARAGSGRRAGPRRRLRRTRRDLGRRCARRRDRRFQPPSRPARTWRAFTPPAGIAIYWIINLVEQQVEVYSDPGSAGYQSTQIFKPGEVVPVVIDGALVGQIAVSELLPPREKRTSGGE